MSGERAPARDSAEGRDVHGRRQSAGLGIQLRWRGASSQHRERRHGQAGRVDRRRTAGAVAVAATKLMLVYGVTLAALAGTVGPLWLVVICLPHLAAWAWLKHG